MPVVTISRQYGSGGSEVAERVARALGWSLYDNAVVDAVAARLGITSEEVEAREERVPSLAERIASAMALGVPEVMPVVGDLMSQPTEERIIEVTRRVMEEAVNAGPAVIVGRGAQSMLAAREDTLHVYCYAPTRALVASAAKKFGISTEEAARRVADVNKQREQYVKKHWGRDWRDFTNYDICINTSRTGREGAAQLVLCALRQRFG